MIIALGSYDVRVAERAAELWHDRYAEYILFSGKSGNLTRGNNNVYWNFNHFPLTFRILGKIVIKRVR